ncbi:hypothetical protein P9112_005490 [Eukaryota sp. TZLM1-RC]
MVETLPIDCFRLLDRIDEGTFGIVYRAEDLQTGKIVALKQLRYVTLDTESSSPHLREISVLLELDHPNILPLYAVVAGSSIFDNVYLCTDFYPYDLLHLITYYKRMLNTHVPLNITKFIIKELAKGLHYLHSHDILHRDIKPSNIFLSPPLTVVLGDFGSAKVSEVVGTMTPGVTTLGYKAPEMLLGDTNYTNAVDMFSLGCVFAQLVTGEALFETGYELGDLGCMIDIMGSVDEVKWPGLSNLPGSQGVVLGKSVKKGRLVELIGDLLDYEGYQILSSLLSWNPEHRPSAHQIINSSWFSSADSELPEIPVEFFFEFCDVHAS